MKKYEILEHKADLKIRVFGKDLKELFENAAEGMFSLITNLDNVKKKIEKDTTYAGAEPDEKKTKSSGKEDAADEKAIKCVLSYKDEWSSFYEQKLRRFNYFDSLYAIGAAKKNAPYGRANLELPLAFQQVEPLVDQLGDIFFGEAPYLPYTGRHAEDIDAAEIITDFTQRQLEEGGLPNAASGTWRNLAKYGTGVMKVRWEEDYVSIEEQEQEISNQKEMALAMSLGMPPPEPQTREVTKIKEEIEFQGLRFHNISLFDFMVPRSATSPDISKLEWCIHRVWRDPETLFDNPNYHNIDKLKELIGYEDDDDLDDEVDNPSTGEQISSNKDAAKAVSLEQVNPKGREKFTGQVELLECWLDHEIDGKKKVPALIVLAVVGDDAVCLRRGKNPLKYQFKPFVAGNDYPVEGEFYGRGELDSIKGLIEESTALRNARLDIANLSLNRSWLVDRQSGINLRELTLYPNKVILTNDMNGVKPVDMGGVTPSSVQELARIDFDIQNTTEIVNPRQDVSNVGAAFGDTATGVNFLSSRTNARILGKSRRLEDTMMKPLAIMINKYNKQFVTDEIMLRYTNTENPYKMGSEAFLTEVDFRPTPAPEKVGRMQRRQDLSYLLQVIAQLEKVAPGTINLMELMKEVFKASGFPHPEKYIQTPQTQLLQKPDGSIVDKQGQQPQIIPIDETGKPVLQPGGPGIPGTGGVPGAPGKTGRTSRMA